MQEDKKALRRRRNMISVLKYRERKERELQRKMKIFEEREIRIRELEELVVQYTEELAGSGFLTTTSSDFSERDLQNPESNIGSDFFEDRPSWFGDAF